MLRASAAAGQAAQLLALNGGADLLLAFAEVATDGLSEIECKP